MRRDYELCEYLLSNNAQATPEQQKIIKRAKEGRGGIWWLSERREMGYPLSEKRKRMNDIENENPENLESEKTRSVRVPATMTVSCGVPFHHG